MNKVIRKIAMLFMVCGLAVSVSFGAVGYGNIDMLKEQIEKFEAYRLDRYSGDMDRAKIDCEDILNSVRVYCEAKVGLLLLEEAKAKKIDYYSYDMKKFIWSDERFKYFRGYDSLDTAFSGIKRRFKEFYEDAELNEARSAVFREWSKDR